MKRIMLLLAASLLCLSVMTALSTDRSARTGLTSSLYDAESVFPDYPPKIDGTVSEGEWDNAPSITLDHGFLLMQNDAANLYLLIDLTGDTHDDPPLSQSPWGDYFWLSFDVNINGEINSMVDVNYAVYPGTHDLGISYYLDPASWTGLYDTHSQLGAGFGSSINSGTSHRIWELAISLSEIDSYPNGLVRIGLKTYSQQPSFEDDRPENFYTDFSNLVEIALVTAQIDLVVLADEDFCDALKPLKEHKGYTGIDTYIHSWQSLNKSFDGWDEPERIKKAIANYEKYCDAKYAMLVGDSNKFPVRYTMTDRGTEAAYNRAFYSADFYYADLYKTDGSFDDWDANDNHYFGELRGETIAGVLNYDQVNLNPDIAVGRVPASTVAEVTTYINKVVNYEFAAYKADWSKRALLTATTDWMTDACQYKEDIASDYLSAYNIYRLYSSGNPCVATPDLNSTNINARLNQGVGFINYIGHGNRDGWAIPGGYTNSDLAALTNTNMLSVAFAAACGTAGFTTEPPYHSYTDIYGTHHAGTENGETFNHVPEQPAAIQVADNPECFAEDFLVEHDTGVVGYVGCVTGAQPFSTDLDKFFFESITYNWDTLGGMWNYMVRKYYQEHTFPTQVDPPDWTVVADFHQPWKFHLFGDPSLRINGVSGIQKQDFAGTYSMNHDGWKGTLELWAVPDYYIDTVPNIEGIYKAAIGEEHSVYGYVRTWTYPLPSEWGPDHKIVFYIDFYDTPDEGDDQEFEGYLFTQTKDAIAGNTSWHSTPFGFYAERFLLSVFNVTLEETYWIHILSTSGVENFNFSQIQKQISFNATGTSGTTGFCNVTLPLNLLWGDFSVWMDGSPMTEYVNYTKTCNDTHCTFYIIYTHSTHLIEIRSAEVIPEFPALIILPLFISISLIAAKLVKKNRRK